MRLTWENTELSSTIDEFWSLSLVVRTLEKETTCTLCTLHGDLFLFFCTSFLYVLSLYWRPTHSLNTGLFADDSLMKLLFLFCTVLAEPGRFNRHAHRPLLLRKKNANQKVSIRTDELAIVIFVLCAWFGIIGIFIKKWGKIRAIEPCQSYFSPEIYDIPLKKSMAPSGEMSPGGGAAGVTSGSLIPGSEPYLAGLQMTSRESRGSLSSVLRRESYPMHVLTGVGVQSGRNYLTVVNEATGFSRQRLNSVFVTPPTRPPTPLPGETSPRRFKSAEDLRSIVSEFTRRKSTLLMNPSHFQRCQQQQTQHQSHLMLKSVLQRH